MPRVLGVRVKSLLINNFYHSYKMLPFFVYISNWSKTWKLEMKFSCTTYRAYLRVYLVKYGFPEVTKTPHVD